jgi:hypothetical protein
MSLSDLASVGSLVSGLTVLASLVYLAQQNRQTARNQRSVIHRTSAERLRNWAALTTQPSLREAFPRFYDGDPSLTEAELTACLIVTYSNIAEFEDHFLQHRAGFVDKAQYDSILRQLRFQCSALGWRAAFAVFRATFAEEFVTSVDALLAETSETIAISTMTSAWRRNCAQMDAAHPASRVASIEV